MFCFCNNVLLRADNRGKKGMGKGINEKRNDDKTDKRKA
jgi:hypothetical protein